MYNGEKILAIIPARGGSKGIKNKNIIDLCGKPLISYTIESALNSKYIDDVIVSTDSEKIADVAIKYNAKVPFKRPQELATDNSKTIDAIIYTINRLNNEGFKYEHLILLQPTEPLRNSNDIDEAIELYYSRECRALASVSEVDDNPILIRTISSDGVLNRMLKVGSTCRRQDMPVYYRVNGCIYINRISELNKNTSFNDNEIPFVMSREHSVDIDEMKDLWIAEYYINNTEK